MGPPSGRAAADGLAFPARGERRRATTSSAVGGDLEPGTILRAYRQGLFPMNVSRRRLGWWSPAERGVIPLDGLRVSRSLRRSCRRYRLSADRAFRGVMLACADRRRPHGWITPAFVDAYCGLHELGWTHSIEAWDDDGELAGGLYGVRIGRLFAGESMVHRERRRVEGRPGRSRRSAARLRRDPARRPVADPAPRVPRCHRRAAA